MNFYFIVVALAEEIRLLGSRHWTAYINVCLDPRKFFLVSALNAARIVCCSLTPHNIQVQGPKQSIDFADGELLQLAHDVAVHGYVRASIEQNSTTVTTF